MKYLWTILGLLALVASTLTANVAVAQSTPEGDAATPDIVAALAAVVPDANDLPTGYAFVGESLISANDLMGDKASTLTDAGFITMYVSVYANPDTNTRIRSYASAWKDADAATAGAALLNVTDEGLTSAPAEIGDEPREATSGTYDDNGTTMTVEGISFRHDAMLLGTAVETSDGSAPDAGLAQDIATVMLDRASSVSEGTSPKNTDLALPGRSLSLSGEGQLFQAGFLGPKEVEGIYNTQGSVLSKLQTSWIESVAFDGNGTVTVGVTTFGSADDASTAVTQSADIFPPLTDQKAVEGASVEGADSVAAYSFSSSGNEKDALNSYRIIFSAGTDLVVIDVQGAPSADAAASTANDLAKAQVGCLGGNACEVPDLAGMSQ